MKLIYITEDHEVIRDGVIQYLKLSGYNAVGFGTIAEESEAIEKQLPDMIIQDVMLPDGDGFMFVKELRSKLKNLPVIFLTARQDESDRITGFELGADDYVTKPFSPKELILRINAVFRRTDGTGMSGDGISIFGDGENTLIIDYDEHNVKINDTLIALTAAEWKMLVCLSGNAPNLVTRNTILEECFNYSIESYERVVDTHIKNIRAKLRPGSWIETVRGYGYRFTGERKVV